MREEIFEDSPDSVLVEEDPALAEEDPLLRRGVGGADAAVVSGSGEDVGFEGDDGLGQVQGGEDVEGSSDVEGSDEGSDRLDALAEDDDESDESEEVLYEKDDDKLDPAPANAKAKSASASEGVDALGSLEELKKALEAVLFATSEPLAIRSLADLFGRTVHDVRQVVEELRVEYAETGRAFRLEELAGGIQLLTLPAYDVWIRKFRQNQSKFRLSAAAFETLAVIAYKQPVTKADLEAIRGVQCGQVIKNLLDRGLVKVTGRDESLGRPLLYGTTPRFLQTFGIGALRDLPQPELQPRRRTEELENDDADEDVSIFGDFSESTDDEKVDAGIANEPEPDESSGGDGDAGSSPDDADSSTDEA